MNMQMPYGLTAVCALVGDETESVLKSELICQGRKFLNAFCESLRLCVGHLDDVGIMLFGNEQKMNGGLRIQVLDDNHIVVFIKFCGRNLTVCYLTKMQSLIYNSLFSVFYRFIDFDDICYASTAISQFYDIFNLIIYISFYAFTLSSATPSRYL